MFEYGPNKRQINKIKHGIDFEETQALFDDSEEEITQYLDLASAKRPNQQIKQVNIGFL